jgi:hypothetical protein
LEVVQALVSDSREAETRAGRRRVEGGKEAEAGGPSIVGKPCKERAKADNGSGAGRAIVGVRRPRRLRRSRKSRLSKVGK